MGSIRLRNIHICLTILCVVVLYMLSGKLLAVGVSGEALIWPALGIYLVSHVFRLLRLGVILDARGIRELAAVHFFSAGCSALFPYKAGELVRINEIARTNGGFWRAVFSVWIERAYDVVAIALIALVALASGQPQAGDILPLLSILVVFLFATATLLFVVPLYLPAINLHVLRTYEGGKALMLLRLLEPLHHLRRSIRPLINGKSGAISVLTACIWLLELVAMMTAAGSTDALSAMAGLARAFSGALSGEAGSGAYGFELLKNQTLAFVGCAAALYLIWLMFSKKKDGIR